LRRRVVVAEAKAVAPDELAKTKKKLLKANAEHKKVAARFNAAASKDRMLQHAAQKIKDAEKDAKMHALAARVVAAEKSAAAADESLRVALEKLDAITRQASANYECAVEMGEHVRKMERERAAAIERAESLEANAAEAEEKVRAVERLAEAAGDAEERRRRHALMDRLGVGTSLGGGSDGGDEDGGDAPLELDAIEMLAAADERDAAREASDLVGFDLDLAPPSPPPSPGPPAKSKKRSWFSPSKKKQRPRVGA
jgi:chemotaxis protein histidine kinase CheA